MAGDHLRLRGGWLTRHGTTWNPDYPKIRLAHYVHARRTGGVDRLAIAESVA